MICRHFILDTGDSIVAYLLATVADNQSLFALLSLEERQRVIVHLAVCDEMDSLIN